MAAIIERVNDGARFNAAMECFTIQEDNGRGGTRMVRLRGLVPCLKELFYPDYRFTGRVNGGDERAPVVDGFTGGTSRAGMERGRRVDEMLQRCVRMGNRAPRCRATRHIFAALDRLGLTPVLTQVRRATLSFFCRSLGSRLSALGSRLSALGSSRSQRKDSISRQVPVHGTSIGMRVGTACDLVCLNAQGQPTVVEVKTGFANYYTASQQQLRSPLQLLPSCPRTHHQLQLMVTCEMFHATTGIRPADAVLLRVIASGVQYIRLDPRIRSSKRAVLDAIRTRFPA